ncbi:hypothetical protein DRQ33_01395 [bacterium]|nr:MAG: hypothetical protein DRQ33_01395 [bacterium]
MNKNILFNNDESHIISVSRRTDIPRYYFNWFIDRMKAGYVVVRNPFNRKQIKRVSLTPDDVSALVFWTRLPSEKFIDDGLDYLIENNYNFAFLWTITGYGKPLENSRIELNRVIDSFQKVSSKIGAKKMVWRYDPIIITDKYSCGWHIKNFENISNLLQGFTDRVIISSMTEYSSVVRRMKNLGIKYRQQPLKYEQTGEMLRTLVHIAGNNNQTIQSCCQEGKLESYGISDGACIDTEWLSSIFDIFIPYEKDRGQRTGCVCTKSIDIGAYDTCPSGCVYCYAVKNHRNAERFYRDFDCNSEGLFL